MWWSGGLLVKRFNFFFYAVKPVIACPIKGVLLHRVELFVAGFGRGQGQGGENCGQSTPWMGSYAPALIHAFPFLFIW